MSKYSHALILLLFLFPITLLAQPIVHHDILAEVSPDKHLIKIIDVVTLDKSMLDKRQTVNFVLHAGDVPAVNGKGYEINELSPAKLTSLFPQFKNNKSSGDVPVNGYQVQIPTGKNSFTIEYTREINHAISRGGEATARSISDSKGLIVPEGVYLDGESLWYPRFANELLSFRLSVRLPAGWKSVSQGERIYVENEKSYHMDTWQEKKSQDDLYLIAAKFHEYSQAAGSVKAMAFLRDQDDALAQKYLDTTAQYLEMYRQLLGPYPYTKFALVENFWETGFGMPSFTLLGPRIIRFPFILHSSYPHELLHNWWGNSVYVDYSEGNWAEGLTAYLADHLIKEQKGQGVLHRRAVLQKYTNFTQDGGDFALKDFVSRFDGVTEAVGYGKTLMVFHMLRQKMGDELFSVALKQFYMRNRYKTAGYSDINKIFSRVAEQDFTPFFNAWVNRAGSPALKLTNVNVDEKNTERYVLNLSIIQEQAGDAYSLDVPIYVQLEGGKALKRQVVKVKKKNEQLNLTFDSKPISIHIDPEFDLFRRLDLNEIPPSLSQAFGAAESVIVIASNATTEMKNAYQQLATSWQGSQNQKIEIIFDDQLNSLPDNKVVWLLGNENKFKSEFYRALSVYPVARNNKVVSIDKNQLNEDQASIVMLARNPKSPKYALAFISADKVEAVAGLGRKLPHYGKYSYLGFEGNAPTNIAKGQWPIVNSPLSRYFIKDAPENKYQKRTALIELSPVFSEKALMNHVNVLAAKEMKGRGIGTKELDNAAKYIADQFKSYGLKPVNGGDYFQSWSQDVEGIGKNVNLKNVIGVLPGVNPKYKGESVIVSAHYDHLGLGEIAAKAKFKNNIHYGADDNASGVSVMLELANLLAKKGRPERSVIFIAFTAEEANKLGSNYYVKNPGEFPLNKIMGVVNLDTVGRLNNNPLTVFATGSASEWVHIFRGAGFVTGVNVRSVAKSFGASDEESFLNKNVPAVHFFSGANEDFHKPTDTIDKIDSAGMVKVSAVLKETVDYLAAREEPLTNQLAGAKSGKQRAKPGSSGRRVSLGTVPDFAYQGIGVRVSSVVENSPADKSGIKADDIIIELNENKVEDLRGFSQHLRKLKPGDEIQVKEKRGQMVMKLKATVQAR